MPSGDREFFELSPHRAYVLEGGGELLAPQIAYETWGNLDAAAGNAVLVFSYPNLRAHENREALLWRVLL